MDAALRIVLVDEDPERAGELEQALVACGHTVVARPGRDSRSSRHTDAPASESARADASPVTPPPITATSTWTMGGRGGRGCM